MAGDNTSAYNFRAIAGTTDFRALSMHAFGRAIDINPMCNPWVLTYSNGATRIAPAGATDPLSRGFFDVRPDCLITRETELGNFVIDTFRRHGWEWGGDWANPKDYQHFQYPGSGRESTVKKAPYCKL